MKLEALLEASADNGNVDMSAPTNALLVPEFEPKSSRTPYTHKSKPDLNLKNLRAMQKMGSKITPGPSDQVTPAQPDGKSIEDLEPSPGMTLLRKLWNKDSVLS